MATHPIFGENPLAGTYPPAYGDERAIVFWDDFFELDTARWTITTSEAGSGSATEAISDALTGGVLVVTNDDADDDADWFNHVTEAFTFTSGQRTGFMVRFKVDDATQSDLVFGLQITDTTPLNTTDGVYFRKDDGDANLDIHSTKNDTSTSASAIAELSDDTWHAIAFEYDGDEMIEYYVDGKRLGSLAVTNLPDDQNLCVSFGIKNGAAAAKVLSVDYIKAWQER